MSHHAQLVLGTCFKETSFFNELTSSNTELSYFSAETLAIADVRNLIKSAFLKPNSQPTKTIVIEVMAIAVESQQALLKVIEEPPQTTKFVIVVPSKASLLPTLLSRLQQVDIVSESSRKPNEYFLQFLQLPLGGRLELIAKLTKDKRLPELNDLSSGVLLWVENNAQSSIAKQLYFDASMMNMRGAAKKMLLEDVALLLPVE